MMVDSLSNGSGRYNGVRSQDIRGPKGRFDLSANGKTEKPVIAPPPRTSRLEPNRVVKPVAPDRKDFKEIHINGVSGDIGSAVQVEAENRLKAAVEGGKPFNIYGISRGPSSNSLYTQFPDYVHSVRKLTQTPSKNRLIFNFAAKTLNHPDPQTRREMALPENLAITSKMLSGLQDGDELIQGTNPSGPIAEVVEAYAQATGKKITVRQMQGDVLRARNLAPRNTVEDIDVIGPHNDKMFVRARVASVPLDPKTRNYPTTGKAFLDGNGNEVRMLDSSKREIRSRFINAVPDLGSFITKAEGKSSKAETGKNAWHEYDELAQVRSENWITSRAGSLSRDEASWLKDLTGKELKEGMEITAPRNPDGSINRERFESVYSDPQVHEIKAAFMRNKKGEQVKLFDAATFTAKQRINAGLEEIIRQSKKAWTETQKLSLNVQGKLTIALDDYQHALQHQVKQVSDGGAYIFTEDLRLPHDKVSYRLRDAVVDTAQELRALEDTLRFKNLVPEGLDTAPLFRRAAELLPDLGHLVKTVT